VYEPNGARAPDYTHAYLGLSCGGGRSPGVESMMHDAPNKPRELGIYNVQHVVETRDTPRPAYVTGARSLCNHTQLLDYRGGGNIFVVRS
jgi:hypothetical protein